MARAKLPRAAKGDRPVFFDDPAIDKLVAMILGLAGEVSVLHDKLDTIEQVAERKGLLTKAELESFVPDAATQARRDAWRETMLDNVLRILNQELERLQSAKSTEYDQVIDQVGR